jgi:hypothetical protein
VHYAVEGAAGVASENEKVFKCFPVREFPLDELHSCRKEVAAAVAEIVKCNCLVSSFDKEACNGSTDVSGTAGNQDLHKTLSFPKQFWLL